MSENNEIEKDTNAFRKWWHEQGSAMRPNQDEDTEEHAHRVAKIAWMNGAYIARQENQN